MEAVLISLGIIMGLLTSYTDIKTGFIDDKHVFPFAALGILYYLYNGIKVGDYFYALSGIIGLGLGFILGYLLYIMGGWASGDIVILMCYSALFPYASSFAKIVAPYTIKYPLHAFTLFFNSIIGIFPFIFIYALGGLIAQKKTSKLKEVFLENAPLTLELSLWILFSLILFLVLQTSLNFSVHPLIRWIATLVLITLFSKNKKVGDALGVVSLIYAIYLTGVGVIYAFIKMLIIFYTFKVLFSIVKVLREEILIEKKKIEEISEWDILGEWIYEKEGQVFRDRESFNEKFRRALSSGDLSILKPDYKNLVASPTAEGLRKEQIEKLKQLVQEGKLENEFLVRKAMPFAPALFLGFLISVFYGDLFWLFFTKLSGM